MIVSVLLGHSAWASEQLIKFNIAAAPANVALNNFAVQADIPLIYSYDVVSQYRLRGLRGRFSVDEAIKRLLDGTCLKANVANNAVTIEIINNNDGNRMKTPACKHSNLFSALAVGLIAAPAVHAQPLPPAAPARLEEVVVTARKVEESQQKIPIAINAMSDADLRRSAVQDFAGIQEQVPALQIAHTATSTFTPLISMRGQTQGSINVSVDPAVGIYTDGVYSSGTSGAMVTSLIDLQRVEVLKGPQGTLYGRNTTGGAINFTTKLPSDTWEGMLRAGAGNYSSQEVAGMVNMPFADQRLALRLVGQSTSRDGYGFDIANDKRVGDQDTKYLRGALKFDATDKLQLVLRADQSKADDNGILLHPIYLSAGSAANRDMANTLYGATDSVSQAAALAEYNRLAGKDLFKVAYNDRVFSTVKVTGTSLTATYDLDAAVIKSITAYRTTEDQRSLEVDGTNLSFFTFYNDVSIDQLTQELQITGNAFDNRFKYASGLFYFKQTADEVVTTKPYGVTTGGQSQITDGHVVATSWALYSQGTYEVVPDVNITLGVRYTDETKDLRARAWLAPNAVSPYACALPAGLNPSASCSVEFSTPNENVSYNLSVDWSPLDEVMVYARTSRGFKSGFINQRIIGGNPLSANEIEPEEVTDYEIGVKSQWFDQRLRVNADVYHSDYENVQRSAVIGPPFTSVITNAAKATIDGFEFDITALPIEGWRVALSAAYTNPAYDEYRSGGIDISNENFLNVPEWSYTAMTGYTLPTGVGDLDAQISWSWRSEVDLAPQDAPGGIRLVGGVPAANGPGTPDDLRIQSSYGVLNGSISLHIDSRDIDIRIFGNNLTDERYYSHILGNVNGGVGMTAGSPGNPRTFGVDVTAHF